MSFGVAAAFPLCFTARHFRDRRHSGPTVTPAFILTFLLLTPGNYNNNTTATQKNNLHKTNTASNKMQSKLVKI